MDVRSSIEKKDMDIYYDIQIKNLGNDQSSDTLQQLLFDERRTSSIVDKASDYQMSVIRFQCDTYSLPVYLAEIQPGSNDPDEMIHDLSMIYRYTTNQVDDRHSKEEKLRWVPADKTQPKPPAPSTRPSGFQVILPYYYAYDYPHLMRIVNEGLERAFQVLKDDALLNPLIYPPDFQTYRAPFFNWESDRGTATLYSRLIFNTTNPTPSLGNPQIELYFNPTLYSMFNALPINKRLLLDDTGYPVFKFPYYQIMIDNNYGGNVIQGLFNQTNERYIKTEMMYSTISELSPIASIIFTSSTLPIVVNQLSEPKLTYNNNVVQLSRPGNNFSTIITDLVNDEGYRGSLLYTPTAQYRMISLTTEMPIRHVDLQVYWKLKQTGELVPFTLGSGGSCSLKLAFLKI